MIYSVITDDVEAPPPQADTIHNSFGFRICNSVIKFPDECSAVNLLSIRSDSVSHSSLTAKSVTK